MNESEAHLERYREHARRLQTWIGAYGAGLATLLVLHFRDAVGELFNNADREAHIVDEELIPLFFKARMEAAGMKDHLREALWLIGIALACQVALLFVNKVTQFYVSHASPDATARNWRERASWRVADWYWIDLICDCASVVLLTVATFEGVAAMGLSV